MIDPLLLNELPPLRRARGDRLYGPDASHWVDLWKQDGNWLLGHRPEGAAKEWKNQVDKGLATWAPSLWPRRLEPLVQKLIPGTLAVRVFRNADRAPQAPLWRPWEERIPEPPAVCRLVLPTGPGQAVAVAYGSGWTGDIPDHDITSPAEAAGLVHAAAQVIRFTVDPAAQGARAQMGQAFDRHLGSFDLFARRGIWLFPRGPAPDYPALFRAHLDGGFLLNPDPSAPSVLPTSLSPGEWARWVAAMKTLKGVG